MKGSDSTKKKLKSEVLAELKNGLWLSQTARAKKGPCSDTN